MSHLALTPPSNCVLGFYTHTKTGILCFGHLVVATDATDTCTARAQHRILSGRITHPFVSLAATSLPSTCSRGLLFFRGTPDLICSAKDVNRGTKIKMVPIGKLRAHRGGDIGPWS